MAIEVGQTARLIQPVVQGEILDTQYNKESKELEHLLAWNEDGEPQQRWFSEKHLEAVQ